LYGQLVVAINLKSKNARNHRLKIAAFKINKITLKATVEVHDTLATLLIIYITYIKKTFIGLVP
jgi:hypothetical protein